MIQEARKYQAFYTKSIPIVDYMIRKLSLRQEDRIFEPCGGDGIFVETILNRIQNANIDVCELNDMAFRILQNKFNNYPTTKVRQCDTLLDNDLIFYSNFGGIYDKIIANPPYGAWQDYDKRNNLKKLFRGCPKKCVNGETKKSIFTIGEHTCQNREKESKKSLT